ncbi:MAG: hypothetical protein PHD48_03655 [Alphaproteobacteria bacterium]|nr:hypothetical protein [Alphaproteobacteria bacterium]
MDTISCTEIIALLNIVKATTTKTAVLRTGLELRRINQGPNAHRWELEALITACNRSVGLSVFMATGMNLLLWPWQDHIKRGEAPTREVEPPKEIRAAFHSTIGTCLGMTAHCNGIAHSFLKRAESGSTPELVSFIPQLNQSTKIFLDSATDTFGKLIECCTEQSGLRQNIICVKSGMIEYSQKYTTTRIAKCLKNAASKKSIASDYA